MSDPASANANAGVDESGGAFGSNNLEAKQQRIADEDDGGMSLDDINEIGGLARKFFLRDLPKAASRSYNAVKDGVTPQFIQRMRKTKIHLKRIEVEERNLDNLNYKVNDTIRREYQNHKEEKERTRLVRQLMEARKHIKAEKKHALQDADKIRVEEEFKEHHKRRQMQLEEANEKINAKLREQVELNEREAVHKRRWRIKFFGEQAQTMKQESLNHHEATVRRERGRQLIDRAVEEWQDREDARTRMQVDGPPPSKAGSIPGLEPGIFAVPMSIGNEEFVGANLHKRETNFQSGIDEHDVHIFHADPHSEYEETKLDNLDIETELNNKQALYDSLQYDSKQLDDSITRLCDMRDILERELRQVTQELLVVERDQAGPPRRLSNKDEKVTIDAWKVRSSKLVQEINEFQHTIDKSSDRKRTADVQLLNLAQQLSVLKETYKDSSQQLEGVNGPLGAMPMVIGRNISKIAGMNGMLAKPKETFDAITHQSRLVNIKAQSEVALKLNKETNKVDNEIWLERMETESKQMDVERVSNLMADISQRLKDSSVNFQRQNIVDALTGFHASGCRLRPTTKKLVGMLPWFKHHDPLLSCAVKKYASNNAMGAISFETDSSSNVNESFSHGVTLMQGEHTGYCVGTVNLPKDCLWSILITVTSQSSKAEQDDSDSTDFVTVKMGPTVTSLGTIGTYFNKVNPLTGTVLYDAKYFFRGTSFAFRFDFSSSSTDQIKHLAVCTGLYEEYEMKALEIINDPKTAGKSRVLSSFVKMIRVDEKSGKLRETRLLEELIAIEESKAVNWDSDVTNNTMQRYSREYFLRILRAEILLQQNASIENMKMKKQELLSARALMADADLDKESKLEQSQKKYLMKKRMVQRRKLDEGKDLVGQRLLLWDDNQSCWRNITVIDCLVHWIENGTVALVTHMVQEFDDGNDKVGVPMELNLKNFKYFPSPIQIVDMAMAERWREKKKWEDEIAAIDTRARDVIIRLEDALNIHVKREEKAFRKSKEKLLKHFGGSIAQQAEKYANSPVAERPLKVELNKVLLDFKKGKEDCDETKNKIEQGKVIARQRFINTFIADRTQAMHEQLEDEEQELRDQLDEKTDEVNAQIKIILAKAENSKAKLKKLIQAQLAARKAAIMTKLRFKPEVFAKAVIKSTNCEHLKTKAWGTNYGTGVKCMICGRELSDLYKEDSQLLGYGSGADPEMWDAINRHRQNEQSFRFKNSEELQAVEKERVRLEKEARELMLKEAYFYDFQDLTVVYDFDRRHAKSIKAAGIFRQGLQWTEGELDYFTAGKTNREKERLEAEGLPSTLLEGYDPLGDVEAPPPTYRAEEERHLAQYKELVFSVGRLHNFRKRIEGFKLERFELLSERDMYAAVLEALHKESYLYEFELTNLEDDLDRTSKLISTFEKMQRLWKQANIIRAQAIKDMKKAQMARCGVWDDVNDQLLLTDFLHDETRGLLRSKLLLVSKLEHLIKAAALRKAHLETCEKQHVEKAKKAQALKLCMPGNFISTRYGDCYVVAYRATDDMLLVQLPFGMPYAKAFLHYQEVTNFMVARQNAENLRMGAEDDAMHSWLAKERAIIKRELAGMAKAEEGLRRYFQFVDLGKNEASTMQNNITNKVEEFFMITESKKYKDLQQPNIDKIVEKQRVDKKARFDAYKGPASGRPKKMSMWDVHKKKKEVALDLKEKFIFNAAIRKEKDTTVQLLKIRSDWVQNYSFELMMDAVIGGVIKEIAEEALQEGKTAKGFAEKRSGVIFPHPWMQYDAYSSLSSIWRIRKEELVRHIEVHKGEASKLLGLTAVAPKKALTPEQARARRDDMRRRAKEKARQVTMCEEMKREEMLVKSFYRWELMQNLTERRMMREEDRAMQLLRLEEAKLLLEAQKRERDMVVVGKHGKGGVAAAGGKNSRAAIEAAAAKKDNTFDRRREELKAVTIERRRREEDQARMIIEDKLSFDLRELDILQRQKAKYIEEYGEDAEEEMPEEPPEEDLDYIERVMHTIPLKVPDWFVAPNAFSRWDMLTKNKYIKLQIQLRIKDRYRVKQLEREERLLDRLREKSTLEWSNLFRVAEMLAFEAELAMMEAQEEVRDAEARLIDSQENIKKVTALCRSKGEEELQSRTELRKREEVARKCDQELKEAEAWVDVCLRRAKNRDKLKRRVYSDCKWVDTSSINGFHQRFATERLRGRLYETYFRQIVSSFINSAEIIATERKLITLQEKLSFNRARLADRTDNLKSAINEMRRTDRMRMRRSVLNEQFFPRMRQKVLKARFGGWVRFYMWNRGHKEAYKLKYEVIKRQCDLDRQFKLQLQTQQKAEKERIQAEKDKASGLSSKKQQATLLQRHRERTISCQKCFQFYIENQNHSMSCVFHSDIYTTCCPSTCPNPGLTALCSAHRMRRWRCCDQTRQEAGGCSRRYHTPPDSDPIYDRIMDKVNDRDRAELVVLDKNLVEARKQNWQNQLNVAKREVIFEIEDEIKKGRDTANRLGNIKWV